MTAGVRKTDHVLKSVYKHAQKDKKEVRFCKKKRRFYHKPPFSGLDGSRTRVQKPIPCPSTIIVCLFAAGLAPARSLLNPGADTLIHSVAS